MKVKKGFLIREVAGQPVVIPGKEMSGSFSGMIKLNDAGKYIWQELEQDRTEDELIAGLAKTYNIPVEMAREDVQAFLAQMKAEGFLEE